MVREPFASIATSAEMVFGCIKQGEELRVTSNMPAGGVIFSDGMEEDRLEFHSGNEATIGIAGKTGKLVYG